MAIYQYGKIFEAYTIEKILENHQNCIFDFGGGATLSGISFEFDRIKRALEPYENIILLIPSTNKEESLKFIYNRRNINPSSRVLIEHLVYDDSHYKLAKHTIFVKDKTPEEICDEVIAVSTYNTELRSLI
jgi:hypothetical protein